MRLVPTLCNVMNKPTNLNRELLRALYVNDIITRSRIMIGKAHFYDDANKPNCLILQSIQPSLNAPQSVTESLYAKRYLQ